MYETGTQFDNTYKLVRAVRGSNMPEGSAVRLLRARSLLMQPSLEATSFGCVRPTLVTGQTAPLSPRDYARKASREWNDASKRHANKRILLLEKKRARTD